MYKVAENLTSAYGSDLDVKSKKNGPDMPHVTTNNRRMTNVKLSNGEYVQGIRRNNDGDNDNHSSPAGATASNGSLSMRPLRYTPGLACDAHLESLRPSRDSKHQPFSGGDEWRKKLIKHPQTYEGSFADADMEQFRPVPNPPPVTSDPWYASRVPEPQSCFPVYDRLAGAHYPLNTSPYDQVYPQDELSRIKMRNRRFQNSCGQEVLCPPPPAVHPMMHPMMQPMQPMYGYGMMHPMMAPPPPQAFMHPMMAPQPMMMSPVMDDLQMLDQELNTTRRVTRPFIPSSGQEYLSLQRQRDFMEEPTMSLPVAHIKSARELCPTSIDDLPPPKKPILPRERKPDLPPPSATKHNQSGVKIADQIAIRSIVLSQNLPKIGGGASSSSSCSKSKSQSQAED